MTESQLNAVIAATGHERYRWLTSDENPDVRQREGYRAIVEAKANALENSVDNAIAFLKSAPLPAGPIRTCGGCP